MRAQGPLHGFYKADSSDDPRKAQAWASIPKRRGLVVVTVMVFVVFAIMLSVLIDGILKALIDQAGFSQVMMGFAPVLLICAVDAFWLDRLVFLASRPGFAVPGEPYDERQQALVAMATRQGLKLALVLLAIVAAVGASPLPAGYAIGVGLASIALAMSGPQLVLAWTLNASDFDFSGEEDEDADG
ncbi:hypothetical protein ACFELO_06595 [Oceanicaulis sp. LC35]|uniref:hypothetical protein n=1 Tax=Oceanicaulis sp. LC35 TaxID=3349635 RepID=UPI003F83C9E9